MSELVGPHGRVVIGGVSFPLVHMTYRGGELVLTASRSGPLAAGAGDSVTIFGPDGIGVHQHDQSVAWPALHGPTDVATLMLPIRTVEIARHGSL